MLDHARLPTSSPHRSGIVTFIVAGLNGVRTSKRRRSLLAVDAPTPVVGQEVGFYDSQSGDGRGADDAWSSYWYNNFVYVNGGLGNRDNRGERGFDIYKLLRREDQHFLPAS
jgi:hypothetical protein